MLKRCLVVTGMLVALALWSASEANAQTFYNLTLQSCGGGGCGTSPFGTVELQQGVNSVIVTVTLTPISDRFSAGGNDVLTFNLSGSGTVTLTGAAPDNLTLATGTFNQTPFGSFSFAVNCMGPMSVCNGSHTSSTNTESFTLNRTGLTVSSFIPNSGGYLFTSDITATTGSGIVAAVTPEPASMLLFGTGLLVVAGIVRRRRPEGASA